ncbi:MAG: hypothetical protein ABW175_20105, partial [Bradyrhizobium sp.]
MKSGRLAVLVVSLLTAGASTASAAPATASGPAALALAGVVALYSPLLTADEREAVSHFSSDRRVCATPRRFRSPPTRSS